MMKNIRPYSTKIESKALTQLKLYIEDSLVIDPYVPERDKEPIWDGHLYLYDDGIIDNEHLIDKVSVQLKGKEVDHFKTEKFSYPIETVDLRAFLNDPVVFIVCQIKRDSKERKLFYRSLLPETVKNLLKKGKKDQKEISVAMKPMPSDYREFEDILLNFVANRRKQIQYAHSLSMPIKEAIKRGAIEFQFSTAVKNMGEIDALQYLSAHPSFLYAKIDPTYNITIPIEGGEFNLIFEKKESIPVKVGMRVFFENIKTIVKEGVVQISAGSALTIEIKDLNDISSAKVQVHCKSDTLHERIQELEFLLALNKEHVLIIGNVEFDANIENIGDVSKLEAQLDYWKTVQKLLSKLHVTKPLQLSKVTPKDELIIAILITSILKDEIVEISPIETGFRLFTIANLQVLTWCYANNENGKTKIGDFFDGNFQLAYNKKGKKIIVSPFTYLEVGCLWNKIDNIPFDQQIPSLTALPTEKEDILEIANREVLAMISCSDKIVDKNKERREILLNQAALLCQWLEKETKDAGLKDLHHVNLMQIIKRQRDMTKDEKKWLKQRVEDNECDLLVRIGACALLDDAESFMTLKNKVASKEFKFMQKQPIAKYFL